ncbi:MAG TPA: TIGR02281 family clan AA aspartic protease [Phenylobacterium sp.]|uniref:TIGR02281 family clan AA aspartic protease n=1 Tax=Phenylobacterium sp. TaxID=1871053 RepID=UPI002BB982FA|nr:TIGR02281 family clan AA aspartic protease [Phenylobacterium sp.]HSV02730.1 TIGR02281 family clan AA aspartic protease [Phenylobacterium sp.]
MSEVLKLGVLAVTVAAASAVGAAAVVALAPKPIALRAARAEAPVASILPGAASAHVPQAIRKAGDGHYWADGEVNGRTVRFLVDTGATAVALTPQDAQRLGIDPAGLRYAYRVVTAGGQIRAASVKLASITVAGARVDNVDALVIEQGLDTSLLGMTYLGRLSRFEAGRGGLVLQP